MQVLSGVFFKELRLLAASDSNDDMDVAKEIRSSRVGKILAVVKMILSASPTAPMWINTEMVDAVITLYQVLTDGATSKTVIQYVNISNVEMQKLSLMRSSRSVPNVMYTYVHRTCAVQYCTACI